MRRRSLVAVVAGLVLLPLAVAAQPSGKVRRIGFLWDTPAVWPHALQGFRDGLREQGWIEGRSIVVEYRWVEGRFERLPGLVDELLRLNVELIVAPTSIYTEAVRRRSATIPVVFASHADPVGSGHVSSLARPGTNATGLTIVMSETMPKSLELLQAAVPGLTRVAVVFDPATPSHRPALGAVQERARALHLAVQPLSAGTAAELDGAFAAAASERAGGILVLSTPLFIGRAQRMADLALTHRLPTMFGSREHVDAGGLLSYSPDRADLYRRAAVYVDRILRGASPGDLPVQQAARFELVLNLRTAKALGLVIPPSFVLRADHVIE